MKERKKERKKDRSIDNCLVKHFFLLKTARKSQKRSCQNLIGITMMNVKSSAVKGFNRLSIM